MIKAHNIRHALLGAIVFITIGSFGACSTDPLAPSVDDSAVPTETAVSATDTCQTIDGNTVCTTVAADGSSRERCVLINNVWNCTGQG